jgi:signal transduction histidine kinase
MNAPSPQPAPPRPLEAPPPTGPESLTPDELASLLASFNDVTARLAATHETLTAQVAALKSELEEANRQVERSRHLAMLGEMAAGIAHEVRNPLGSIALYARMLEQDLADRPEQQRTASKIAAAVGGLERIVSDVLVFARQTRPRPCSCDSAELLRAAWDSARRDEPIWQTVEAVFEPVPDDAASVTADPGMLQQALVNLIRNAVEAMAEVPPPRRLRLSAARHTVLDPDGSRRPMIALRVRDTGPGIDHASAQRLFQPFFTTRASGTGLGLAIVHRIVDAHLGRVTLTNAPAAGSPRERPGAVAEILLPCPGAEPPPSGHSAATPADTRPRVVTRRPHAASPAR